MLLYVYQLIRDRNTTSPKLDTMSEKWDCPWPN